MIGRVVDRLLLLCLIASGLFFATTTASAQGLGNDPGPDASFAGWSYSPNGGTLSSPISWSCHVDITNNEATEDINGTIEVRMQVWDTIDEEWDNVMEPGASPPKVWSRTASKLIGPGNTEEVQKGGSDLAIQNGKYRWKVKAYATFDDPELTGVTESDWQYSAPWWIQ